MTSMALVDHNGGFNGLDPVEAYPPQQDAPAVMSDDDLSAALQREERAAINYRDSSIADDQANAIDFYEGQPLGDEEEGLSQIVTRDVAETVDYMAISVLRTCVSGDRVVEFEAKQPGQEDAAAQATEAVSTTFMRGQDGYKVLHDWLQSGLIEKIGIVKTACITEHKNKRARHRVDGNQLAMLDMGMHPEAPNAQLLDYHDHGDGSYTARIQTPQSIKRYVDYTVPSEEFLFSARCRHEDGADYIAQRSRKTLSDLAMMGFDQSILDNLPTNQGSWWDDERSYARWKDEDAIESDRSGAMREVTLFEEYIRIDRDGDGIAELLKVFRVGDVILDVEEVDEQPFVVFCPFPRAHRMVGNSLAEKVMDIQRVSTAVTRQTLDGLYLSNRPRAQIDEDAIGENTIDDYLTPAPGVLIRTKSKGVITPLGDAFDITRGLSMLQYLNDERGSRTGITRLNQGLDADALNTTATGTALMSAQGQQMEEFVARNFAEALGRLFAKKLRIMHDEGDPLIVRLDGEPQQVDPSSWDPDITVGIRVGLGSGRKDQRIGYWQQIVADQMALKANGSPLVTPENEFRVRDGAIRDMGIGMPTEFYTDPATLPPPTPQPPQPNPDVIKAQGDVQTKQQLAANAHELAVFQAQTKAQQTQTDAETKQLQVQHAAQLATEEAAQKANLAHAQQAAQAALAVRGQDFDMQLAREKWEHEKGLNEEKHQQAMDMAVPKFRPGGALDQ